MSTLISHPTSNQTNRALVYTLNSRHKLLGFYTAVAFFFKNYKKKSSIHFLNELKRRSFRRSIFTVTKTKPFRELGRLICIKLNLRIFISHEKGFFSIDKVYENHDRWVASKLKKEKLKGLKSIYAYEDGALESFIKAKNLGINCLYELPIGYWRSAQGFYQKEMKMNPEWSTTLTLLKDSDRKLRRKDNELALSDTIFVASSFTRDTLREYPGKLPPIKVIPYGFPEVNNQKRYIPLINRKLKLLFVGSLSQRKGLSYLFESIKGLEQEVVLTLIGKKGSTDCPPLNLNINQHRWIPSLSHQEVLSEMRSHDLLLFPSLFEGFGLVITEAMSQGTPVITTERTAGPDIITHGVDGWLVNAGSSKSIREVLEEILESPSLIQRIGLAAQKRAKLRPWSLYGTEVLEIIEKLERKNN